MNATIPPRRTPMDPSAAAQRAVQRGVTLGRLSGLCLIAAGGFSVLLCLLHPVSAGMLISIAVLANGIIEWRYAGRLRELRDGAVDVLAFNQIALGVEIGLYAVWRAQTLDPGVVEGALRQPMVMAVLELYPPDLVELMREMLPTLVRGALLAGAAVAVLGCVIMALYYRARRKHVARLVSPAART